MDNLFARSASAAARHPARTLVLAMVLVASLGAGLSQANPGRITELFVPDDLPALEPLRQIEATWGENEMAFALAIDADPLRPELIRALAKDMDAVAALAYVDSAQGLPTMLAAQLGSLDDVPDAELRAAAEQFAASPAGGNFVSDDALLVRIEMQVDQDPVQVTDELNAIADKSAAASAGADVRMAGVIFIERHQADSAGGDVGILMPLSLVVVIGVLSFLFRRFQDVAAPLITVLLAIVMAYGTVAWVGLPLAPPSFIVMPLLLGLGIDYMLHVVYAYRELDPSSSVADRFSEVAGHVGYPVFYTAITTLIGFGSFTVSSVPQIRTWGLLIGSGALYAFLLGFTVLPALYRLRRLKQRPAPPALAGILDALSTWVPRNRRVILVVGAIVTIGFAAAATQIEVTPSVEFEPNPDEPNSLNLAAVQSRFGGQSIAQFLVVAGDRDALGALEQALDADPVVGFIDGPATRLARAGTPQAPLPHPAAQGVATQDWWRILVGYDARDRDNAIEVIEALGEQHFPAAELTGQDVLQRESEALFLGNIALSTGIALGLVVLLLVVVFRSAVTAAIAFFPLLVTVVWQLGIQSLVGIPLNPITGVMTAMMIGVGVDYSIHIVAHWRTDLGTGMVRAEAAARAIQSVGKPVLAATMTTMFAFAVLGFSSLLPLRDFGRVAAIVVGCAFVVSLSILPAVLSLGKAAAEPRSMVAGKSREALLAQAARAARPSSRMGPTLAPERRVRVHFEDRDVAAWFHAEGSRPQPIDSQRP